MKTLLQWILLFGICSSDALAGVCADFTAAFDGSVHIKTLHIATPGERRMKSTIKSVSSEVFDTLERHAQKKGKSFGSTSTVRTMVAFVLEESMQNAAMWGNKHRSSKSISVTASADENYIYIKVTDQGETPFDPSSPEIENQSLGAKTGKGDGLFWSTLQGKPGVDYQYQFDQGSHVTFRIPWSYDEQSPH